MAPFIPGVFPTVPGIVPYVPLDSTATIRKQEDEGHGMVSGGLEESLVELRKSWELAKETEG
jgi:hypothetical protein